MARKLVPSNKGGVEFRNPSIQLSTLAGATQRERASTCESKPLLTIQEFRCVGQKFVLLKVPKSGKVCRLKRITHSRFKTLQAK